MIIKSTGLAILIIGLSSFLACRSGIDVPLFFEGHRQTHFVPAEQVNDWPSDDFRLTDVSVDRDSLMTSVEYGGGCESHEFNLIAGDRFYGEEENTVDIIISHNSHDDPCEALLRRTITFDLEPIQERYRENYSGRAGVIQLNLKTEDGQFLLTYSFL